MKFEEETKLVEDLKKHYKGHTTFLSEIYRMYNRMLDLDAEVRILRGVCGFLTGTVVVFLAAHVWITI